MMSFQVQLHAVRRPGRDTAAEEISIFCPHRDVQHNGDGNNRPVLDVARDHSLSGELPEIPIERFIHGLDKQIELIEQRDPIFRVAAAAAEYLRNVFAGIVEATGA